MEWWAVLAALCLLQNGAGQFLPPPKPFPTVITSPSNSKIKVSYKEPTPGTCETTFPEQKQYTGYVTLPPYTLAPIQQNYTINTFFWFVEARVNSSTAPLSIFINGGPGSSSMIGFFQENGPCEVIQLRDGSYATQPRLWGWDRLSNMLFLDQPVQVGLSYDSVQNVTRNFKNANFYAEGETQYTDLPRFLIGNGTFSSLNGANTANTTKIAAQASWHFLQAFLSAFPKYNPGVRPNSTTIESAGIHLFAESYGGTLGPIFADAYEENYAKRSLNSSVLDIRIATLGLINGLIDIKTQVPWYPRYANNNTYGLVAISLTDMYNELSALNKTQGCYDLIDICRLKMKELDPNGYGDNAQVNDVCASATRTCLGIQQLLWATDMSVYDIRQGNPLSIPSNAYVEYLNNREVQQSIGAAVNFTDSSMTVFDGFQRTGDIIREEALVDLASLLRRGVRVVLMYGDADFICNWFGGEAVASELAAKIPAYAVNYPLAGYADIIVNDTYIGGVVKQYGNFSFARVYEAGHQVPSYQPETAFTLFARAIQGTSIATGQHVNLTDFRTEGPSKSLKTHKPGPRAKPVCWIRNAYTTCSRQQSADMLKGKGVVLNGVWYEKASDWQVPGADVVGGKPGSPLASATTSKARNGRTSTSMAQTGVYTATGTVVPNSAEMRGGSALLATIAFVLALAVEI